jgi:hypothetical protein
MNDFSEIENELRALRPVAPSDGLVTRVDRALGESDRNAPAPDNVIRPARFHFGWTVIGLGLAAAAAFLILARVNLSVAPSTQPVVASINPAATTPAARLSSAQFIPAGASRVVYRTQDEGLLFPRGSTAPVRRVRSRGRETLRWQNPETGASLRVSYPSEEVQLIPIAGQ